MDLVNHRVRRFDREGRVFNTWGGPGSEEGRLIQPGSIALNPDSNWVYVVDTGNNRIQKFDFLGRFLDAWGAFGIANGDFR